MNHEKIYLSILVFLFLSGEAFGGKILSKLKKHDSDETQKGTHRKPLQKNGSQKAIKNPTFPGLKELTEQPDPSENESSESDRRSVKKDKGQNNKTATYHSQCLVENSSEENWSGSEESSSQVSYPLILQYGGETKIITTEEEFLKLIRSSS